MITGKMQVLSGTALATTEQLSIQALPVMLVMLKSDLFLP